MAARTVPGAAEKPARRAVPGAPPLPPAKPGKKSKGGAAKNGDAVKVPNPTAAAFLEKAPETPNQVANALKVTAQDLAEQAEAQAAVAAVQTIEASTQSISASTPAQKVISNRIAELSSKSKNATITIAIDELKSLLNKVQQVESDSESISVSVSAPSASSTSAESDSKAHLVLLLQFLHLFNLFHPNPAGPSTFAPSRTMPRALEMSTGQQVAALAKVYDQLANGPLEGGGGDAFQILDNIKNGSDDQVFADVSFSTIRSMILNLTAPPAAASSESQPEPSGLDSAPKNFVSLDKPSPSAAPVSFIQASEILDRSAAEPKGDQPSNVSATGATETINGKQGGGGTVSSKKNVTSSRADETAASAVQQPIQTAVKSVAEPKLNWATLAEEDDDDLGEAPVFEPLPSSTASALVTPAPGTPTTLGRQSFAASAASAAVKPTVPASSANAAEGSQSPKSKKGKQNSGSKGNPGARNGNGNGNGNTSAANAKIAAAAPKTPKGPKVDQDGFILQESKKTKYLQQKQQQQQQRASGGVRGSKGGANAGRGARFNAGGANRATKSAEATTPIAEVQ